MHTKSRRVPPHGILCLLSNMSGGTGEENLRIVLLNSLHFLPPLPLIIAYIPLYSKLWHEGVGHSESMNAPKRNVTVDSL